MLLFIHFHHSLFFLLSIFHILPLLFILTWHSKRRDPRLDNGTRSCVHILKHILKWCFIHNCLDDKEEEDEEKFHNKSLVRNENKGGWGKKDLFSLNLIYAKLIYISSKSTSIIILLRVKDGKFLFYYSFNWNEKFERKSYYEHYIFN